MYSSVITGSFIHNEQIERLWCDMHRCVGSNYGDLFRSLERDHLLDLLNEVDLYCLLYVYLPQNKCLLESWNHHEVTCHRIN